MEDFNILNRADFDQKILSFDITTAPGGNSTAEFPLTSEQTFWLRKASWAYSMPPQYNFMQNWPPKSPQRISVEGMFQDQIESPVEFKLPKYCTGQLKIKVHNTSQVPVMVNLKVDGVLVTSKTTFDPLSYKEMLGWIMLDPHHQGNLILKEAAVDRWDEKFKQIRGSSLRDCLPGGQMSPMLQLTDQVNLSGTFLQNITTKELPALPNKPDQTAEFIGDLITSGLLNDVTQVREIASHMIQKGWTK